MWTVLLLWLWMFQPTQQTDFCYALAEPYKHWPLYLEVTEQLDTCTHNWYTADVFLEDERHTPSIWNHVYRPSIPDLVRLAETYPGRYWLLYNEPELPGQADTTPNDAAIHARYWMEAISDNGETACCGLSIDERLPWEDWLNAYLEAGGPVPDLWHIHIYAENPEAFERRWASWQAWNAEHGNLKTIISEAGFGLEMYEYLRTWQHENVPRLYWFGLWEPMQVRGFCPACTQQLFAPLIGDWRLEDAP
jgi:hypothetical protein